MMKIARTLILGLSLTALGCNSLETPISNIVSSSISTSNEEKELNYMKLELNGIALEVELEHNDTTITLINLLRTSPISMDFSDYGGFEKVGELGFILPRDDKQITTEAGDVVLYNGNNIVIFYSSNSWSYTRIGKIKDISNLKTVLGSGDIKITLSIM